MWWWYAGDVGDRDVANELFDQSRVAPGCLETMPHCPRVFYTSAARDALKGISRRVCTYNTEAKKGPARGTLQADGVAAAESAAGVPAGVPHLVLIGVPSAARSRFMLPVLHEAGHQCDEDEHAAARAPTGHLRRERRVRS